jgi:hypothetical protein
MEMSLEFYESLKWSLAAFVCGVFLREYAPDSLGKWLGRGGVLVSLFAMSAFGAHAARECSTLIQLVEKKQEATGIAGKTIMTVMAADGSVLMIGEDKDGVRRLTRKLQQPGGHLGDKKRGAGGINRGDATASIRSDGPTGGRCDGEHDVFELPEWTRWFSRNVTTGPEPVSFSGKTAGRDF